MSDQVLQRNKNYFSSNEGRNILWNGLTNRLTSANLRSVFGCCRNSDFHGTVRVQIPNTSNQTAHTNKMYPPASKANLTGRKNLHTPAYGVKEFVCLSVCLWQTLTPIMFATLAARAFFVSSLLLQKQLIYYFWAGNNYSNLPHSQGGMTFATQISPLLNLYIKWSRLSKSLAYQWPGRKLNDYEPSKIQTQSDFEPPLYSAGWPRNCCEVFEDLRKKTKMQ